jgi:CubicO group peptidase (beta-lactamase class C family)
VVSALALALAVLAQPQFLKGLDSVAFSQGFSGVIFVDDETSMPFLEAYGLAEHEKGTPNEVDTKFVTASVAQTFTAAAIATLVADGKVAYDAPLSRYLPDSVYPHARSAHMTIRQLLTHTAGLGPGVVAIPAFRAAPQSFTRLSQIIALIRAQPLAGDTGHFAYSGADCDLLGAVIESVSGLSFAAYVNYYIFAEAGMAHSSFDFSRRPADLAHGYTTRGGLRSNDAIFPRVGVPEAVAYTSAVDLSNFARWLMHGPLHDLIADTVSTGQDGPNHAYGYGFFVGTIGPNRIVNHGGTGPGIDNAFDIYPDLHLIVVILSNQDPPAAQTLRQYLRDRIASEPKH